jgi:raffinose/stachyose/melibiose transport system substrate-binding protein
MKKLVTVLLALSLAVCAFAGGNKESTGTSSDVIELEMYYYKQENQEGLLALLDAYMAKNPGVKIKTLIIPNDADATMAARAAQGKLADILQMQSYSRVQEYAASGYLVDLTNEAVMKKVVPGSIPAVTYNNKQYALPMDMAGIGIIYNKDIFTKLGLKAPTTYRELENVSKILKDNGITPFSGLLAENWSAGHFITLVQTSLLAEKDIDFNKFIADMNAGKTSYGAVDTGKLFSTMDFYAANMDANAGEMAWDQQQNAFVSGKAAMIVQGLWSLPAKADFSIGFIPFPVSNTAKNNKFYADVDSCFGVSAQASPEKRQAALDFLNWLSTAEAQKLWIEGYRLTLSFTGADVSALPPAFTDLISGVSAQGSYPWLFSMYPSIVFEDACKNGAQQYMLKKITADKVIENIDAMWKSAK